MPINKYQDQIQTSIRGREIGLDSDRRLVGVPGVRVPTEFSTASSTLDNDGGLSVLSGTTAQWTLAAPLFPGVQKYILNASTVSTATLSFVRSTALGACTFVGSTDALGVNASGVRVNLIAAGAGVELISISSAVWAPVAAIGSSASYTVSTSS